MILPPHNDHACLGPTTEHLVAEVAADNHVIVDLAKRFSTTDELAAHFRRQPQRDDDGIPGDGPKMAACYPPQRLLIDNPMPNCFERTWLFIAAAEKIDPSAVYRMATISTPNGLHTFPTRNGKPVILDPIGTRNTPRAVPAALDLDQIATRRLRIERLIGTDERKGIRGDLARALRSKALGHTTWVDGQPIDEAIGSYLRALAHFQVTLAELDTQAAQLAEVTGQSPRNACGDIALDNEPVVLTPREAVDWIADLAMTRADRLVGGPRRIENGHRAMRGVLVLRPICLADIRDVAVVLALAEREARAHGIGALKIVHSTARAIDALDQVAAERAASATRNASFASLALGALAGNKDLQRFASALTRVAGRIATNVGIEAAKVKLASVGVSPPVVTAFEKELNREGLTLGPFAAAAPIVGSLEAMTPQALAGRWLAQKL